MASGFAASRRPGMTPDMIRALELPDKFARAGTLALIQLDIGRPDHFAPLLGFLSDELAEVGGRARKCRAAQIGKPHFRVRVGEYLVDLPVELVDDLGGRTPRRAHAVPRGDLVAGYKLADGRK